MWMIGSAAERAIDDIAGDADDGHPGRGRGRNAPFHPLANGILTRPEARRQPAADDGDGPRLGLLLGGERAAADNRDAEGFEVLAVRPGDRDAWRDAPGVARAIGRERAPFAIGFERTGRSKSTRSAHLASRASDPAGCDRTQRMPAASR